VLILDERDVIDGLSEPRSIVIDVIDHDDQRTDSLEHRLTSVLADDHQS